MSWDSRYVLTAPWLIDRPMNRRIFETWVETQLAPTLQHGDVFILDNLSNHKSEKAKTILKERGGWFLFLPPYSPDLNPIEMAFAKLKAHLRRIGARTIDALWRAAGSICELYSPEECWNYLEAAGYAPDQRLDALEAVRKTASPPHPFHRTGGENPALPCPTAFIGRPKWPHAAVAARAPGQGNKLACKSTIYGTHGPVRSF